jgi:hypothetical protein
LRGRRDHHRQAIGRRGAAAQTPLRLGGTIVPTKDADELNNLFAASPIQPIRIEEFTGNEEDAKRHVAALNLHRRHLTTAQREPTALRLFEAEARKETAKHVGGRPKKR